MEMCCMRCAKEGRVGRDVALVGGSEIEGMEKMVNMERGKMIMEAQMTPALLGTGTEQ